MKYNSLMVIQCSMDFEWLQYCWIMSLSAHFKTVNLKTINMELSTSGLYNFVTTTLGFGMACDKAICFCC